MALIKATDAELRSLIFDNKRVLVKFVDENCSICKALAPSVTSLSEQERYRHIVFLQIEAATNPVSAKEVHFTKAPFFAGYVDGMLTECGVKTTKKGVIEILEKIL